MRIAILGNCQVYGVKHAVRDLLPGHSIDDFPLATLPSLELREQAADKLRGYDLVFSQLIDSKKWSPLQTAEVVGHATRLVTFPALTFTGFHPDQVLLLESGGTPLRNVSGGNHSAIVAASFANGLPENRVADLFNSYIFERLGYFAEYAKSKDFVTRAGSDLAFDLGPYFPTWQAFGAFMHTNNHPTIRVLATIARDAVAKAGLCDGEQSVPPITYDALGSVERWPVYPEIARRLSLKGEYLFTRRNPVTRVADAACMSLDEFIFECYKLYKTLPEAIFRQNSIAFARKLLASEVMS